MLTFMSTPGYQFVLIKSSSTKLENIYGCLTFKEFIPCSATLFESILWFGKEIFLKNCPSYKELTHIGF